MEVTSTAAEATTKRMREPAFRKPNQSRAARRQRDLINALIRDLGREPNAAEMALIDQAAALILHRESLSAATLRGEPCDSQTLIKIAGAVTRCLCSLRTKGGKVRVASGPTLADYLERKRLEKAANAPAGNAP